MVARTVVLAVNPDTLTKVRKMLAAASITLSPDPIGGEETMRIHALDAPHLAEIDAVLKPQDVAKLMGLSERGFQVLRLLGCGLSLKEIGDRLCLGEMTVKSHSTKLYKRLRVSGAAEAVAVGFRTGMLTGGES